jgi:pre-mRNA-splicing factor ATP-dependent RNA helicase DHX15/PRP43
VRPINQRREADAAKALLTIPDSDHLTLLNVYNYYEQCKRFSEFYSVYLLLMPRHAVKHDKSWTRLNYVSERALAEAENVRAQLQRIMERFEFELVTLEDPRKLCENVRIALVCGFFMQVAHQEGEKGNYRTVKDNQVCFFVNVCGIELQL